MNKNQETNYNKDLSKDKVPKLVLAVFLWETMMNFLIGGFPVYPFTDKYLKPRKTLKDYFGNVVIALLVIGVFYLLIKYEIL